MFRVTTMEVARRALGLTQFELARRAGTNQPMISLAETGRTRLSDGLAETLGRILNVDPDLLQSSYADYPGANLEYPLANRIVQTPRDRGGQLTKSEIRELLKSEDDLETAYQFLLQAGRIVEEKRHFHVDSDDPVVHLT